MPTQTPIVPGTFCQTAHENRFSADYGLLLGSSYHDLWSPRGFDATYKFGGENGRLSMGASGELVGSYGYEAGYNREEGLFAKASVSAKADVKYLKGEAKGALGTISGDVSSEATAFAEARAEINVANGTPRVNIGAKAGADASLITGSIKYDAPTLRTGILDIDQSIRAEGHLIAVGGVLGVNVATPKTGYGVIFHVDAGITPLIGGNIHETIGVTVDPLLLNYLDH